MKVFLIAFSLLSFGFANHALSETDEREQLEQAFRDNNEIKFDSLDVDSRNQLILSASVGPERGPASTSREEAIEFAKGFLDLNHGFLGISPESSELFRYTYRTGGERSESYLIANLDELRFEFLFDPFGHFAQIMDKSRR